MMETANIHQIPRRYEDTKPAIEQAFAHRTILDIGQRISQKAHEKFEHEKRVALDELEVKTWKKAEEYKDKCVEEALKSAEARHRRFVTNLQKQHEENLRKEVSRIEGITQHRGFENVHLERQRGEKKLNEVVAKLHAQFAVEKSAALEEAREEERSIASQRREEMRRQYEQEKSEQLSSSEEKERNNLEELRMEMEEKMRETVRNTISEQEGIAQRMAEELTESFTRRINELNQEINELTDTQRKTETALHEMENLKNKYVEKLKETADSFTSFIEKCRPDFFSGQSDFVVPSNIMDV